MDPVGTTIPSLVSAQSCQTPPHSLHPFLGSLSWATANRKKKTLPLSAPSQSLFLVWGHRPPPRNQPIGRAGVIDTLPLRKTQSDLAKQTSQQADQVILSRDQRSLTPAQFPDHMCLPSWTAYHVEGVVPGGAYNIPQRQAGCQVIT